MGLLKKLRSRQADMKTLASVMEHSLAQAANAGEEIAGAHHLALAVFAMPDGAAETVMAELGTSGSAFEAELKSLDATTLTDIGFEIVDLDLESGPVPPKRLGKTDATYEAAIKAAYEFHNTGTYEPLSGAHLLAGIASVDLGVAARVFRALGVDRDEVVAAAIAGTAK